jgi:hypothetical protein
MRQYLFNHEGQMEISGNSDMDLSWGVNKKPPRESSGSLRGFT